MVNKKASRVSSDSSDSSTESEKGSDGLMKGLKVIITNLTDGISCPLYYSYSLKSDLIVLVTIYDAKNNLLEQTIS